MATFEKRTKSDGSVSWRVRIRKKGSPRITETFSTKSRAQRWAKKTESDIEEGIYFGADRHRTVSDLVDRYLEYDLVKLGDQKNRRHCLEWWKARIGAYTVGDRTALRAKVGEELDHLLRSGGRDGEGLSPASVNRYHAAMARVFSLAVKRWGWAEFNPFLGVEKEREPQVRVRYLSDDERKSLLEACDRSSSPSLYVFVLIALRTGARQGSIASLTWKDVQLHRRQIVFRNTKNQQPVTSHIPVDLLAVLKQWGRVRAIGSDLVFPRGFPQKAWQTALRRSGVEDFRFHDLRHTFASYMAMAGADLLRIKEQLGHKTLSMIQKYAHLAPGHSNELIERISAEQAGGSR